MIIMMVFHDTSLTTLRDAKTAYLRRGGGSALQYSAQRGVYNPWRGEALPRIFKCHFRAAG